MDILVQINGAVIGPVRWKSEHPLFGEHLPKVVLHLWNCREFDSWGRRE